MEMEVCNRYNKRKRKCSTGAATKAKNSKWEFFERFLEQILTERSVNSATSDSKSVPSAPLPTTQSTPTNERIQKSEEERRY